MLTFGSPSPHETAIPVQSTFSVTSESATHALAPPEVQVRLASSPTIAPPRRGPASAFDLVLVPSHDRLQTVCNGMLRLVEHHLSRAWHKHRGDQSKALIDNFPLELGALGR